MHTTTNSLTIQIIMVRNRNVLDIHFNTNMLTLSKMIRFGQHIKTHSLTHMLHVTLLKYIHMLTRSHELTTYEHDNMYAILTKALI